MRDSLNLWIHDINGHCFKWQYKALIYTFAQYLCLECESSISTKVDGDDGDPTQSDHDDSGPKLVAFVKSTFITQSIDKISI